MTPPFITSKPILDASGLPLRVFRQKVGASTASVKRYLDGPMPLDLADAWSIRIGLHPAEVYGADVWSAALDRSAQ